MNTKNALWMAQNGIDFYYIPTEQLIPSGEFPIESLSGGLRLVDKKQLERFRVSKHLASQLFLDSIVGLKKRLQQKTKDQSITQLQEVLAPLFEGPPKETKSQVERALTKWLDQNFPKQNEGDQMLQVLKKLNELLPQEGKEQVNLGQLATAIEKEMPEKLAGILLEYAAILRQSPNQVHVQVLNSFIKHPIMKETVGKIKVEKLKGFNTKFADEITGLAHKLRQPFKDIDLEKINKGFEEKIYKLLGIDNPEEKNAEKRQEKYKKDARRNIKNALKKSGFKSFSEYRNKHK